MTKLLFADSRVDYNEKEKMSPQQKLAPLHLSLFLYQK